mgnify:CR=1 FL=1
MVIAGGVNAEAHPEEMLQNPFIDVVVRGDGEQTMLDLVKGLPHESIPGLSHRVDNQVVNNRAREMTMDLDEFPMPAYHLIDFDNYFPPAASYKDLPAMNMLMTRGCPGKCTFCNSAKTVLRNRSVESMIELIKMLRYDYGVRQIYFYDDTFTANRKNVIAFCELMIEQKIDVSWICYVRGDMFSEELAELMAKAGCHQVLIGVESGSQTLMAKIGKPIDVNKYKATVERAHRHGMEVRASFIIGHEEETAETMQETVDFAKWMDVDLFQLNVMTPYPGTQLFKELKLEGKLIHEEYHRYGQNEIVFRLKNIEHQEVYAFEKEAFRQFYLRPSAIFRQLKRLRNIHMLKDLFTVFTLTFLNFGKDGANDWDKWLDYDLEKHRLKDIETPSEPNLTYVLRQNFDLEKDEAI